MRGDSVRTCNFLHYAGSHFWADVVFCCCHSEVLASTYLSLLPTHYHFHFYTAAEPACLPFRVHTIQSFHCRTTQDAPCLGISRLHCSEESHQEKYLRRIKCECIRAKAKAKARHCIGLTQLQIAWRECQLAPGGLQKRCKSFLLHALP